MYYLTVVFCTISISFSPLWLDMEMVHDPRIKSSVQWHQNCDCLQTIHFPSWMAQAALLDSRQKRQLGYS